MSRAPELAPMRLPLPIALLLGGVLALLLPPMLAPGADPWSGAVAVLALALVALVGLGPHGLDGRAGVVGAALRADDAPTPVRAGRVTDPTHHPLRPRAPGPAS